MVTPYVPDDRLARFRALDERAMPDTATITRTSPGVQNADGSFEDGTTTTVTYPCRIAPLGSSPVEQVYAARLENVTGFTITLPWNADVNEKDVIVSGTQKYQVLGVLNPTSFQTSVKVACKRIT
jgi:hypothetical protein